MTDAAKANAAIDEELGPRGDGLPSSNWPEPPAPEAYYGLAGDIVRLVEPSSEADPVALLSQTLATFGSSIGRNASFQVEGDRHYPNTFMAMVGETSKARKGVSFGRVRQVFSLVDPDFVANHIAGGLSSGEGLIYRVRDEVRRTVVKKNRGGELEEEDVVEDEGVEDKRLLVVETELAQTLKVLRREGNILSAIIRQAWDRGDLQTMTKNDPIRATGAHISIIGHIGRRELLRHLDETEYANGFGNRFLWLAVRRSKLLPDGGNILDEDLTVIAERLKAAIDFGSQTQEMRRDDEARSIWHRVYGALSEGRPGLAGGLLARAEAQVLRLSMLYALLDRSMTIRAEHLMAALALWEYAERTVQYIFGDRLGDPVADSIMGALRTASAAGLTRTDIANLFGRHETAAHISRALTSLEGLGLAYQVIEDSGGRPSERWRGLGS